MLEQTHINTCTFIYIQRGLRKTLLAFVLLASIPLQQSLGIPQVSVRAMIFLTRTISSARMILLSIVNCMQYGAPPRTEECVRWVLEKSLMIESHAIFLYTGLHFFPFYLLRISGFGYKSNPNFAYAVCKLC